MAERLLRPRHHSPIPLIICSDSLLTIDILDYATAPVANQPLAHEVRSMVTTLREQRPVRFLWTPGHSNIAGNELVDRLVDVGARSGIAQARSRGFTPPYDHTTGQRTASFATNIATSTRRDIGVFGSATPTLEPD